jgi:hypothetical protein
MLVCASITCLIISIIIIIIILISLARLIGMGVMREGRAREIRSAYIILVWTHEVFVVGKIILKLILNSSSFTVWTALNLVR